MTAPDQDRAAFEAEFAKLGYLWSDSNKEKAYLGWRMALAFAARWQPIETAPRGEVEFLATDGEMIDKAWFGWMGGDPERPVCLRADWASWEPTLWMPLPATPQAPKLQSNTPKLQSNALWPPGVCASQWGDGISTDKHRTEEEAESCCRWLLRVGFGGEGKVFPLRVWVSEIQQPPVIPVGGPTK